MDLPKHKIFIPAKGTPKIITNDMEEFSTIIGCKSYTGKSIVYLGHFGYQLAIFFDECFALKNLPINRLATLIFKEAIVLRGNCILFDDEKELSLDDLSKIVKIATAIPSSDFVPEPLIEEFINDKTNRWRLF